MTPTSADDAAYWQLSDLQAADFHCRISRYYARLARRLAQRAARYGRIADRLSWVGLALVGLALVSLLVSWAA